MKEVNVNPADKVPPHRSAIRYDNSWAMPGSQLHKLVSENRHREAGDLCKETREREKRTLERATAAEAEEKLRRAKRLDSKSESRVSRPGTINVGTIAHVGRGGANLTTAIALIEQAARNRKEG